MNTNWTTAEIARFALMGIDASTITRPAADIVAMEQTAAIEAATGRTVQVHGTPQQSVLMYVDVDVPFYGSTRNETVAKMYSCYCG